MLFLDLRHVTVTDSLNLSDKKSQRRLSAFHSQPTRMDTPPQYSAPTSSQPSTARSDVDVSSRPELDIVVAIDFGTTFTGVAFIHSSSFKNQSFSAQEIADRIKVLKQWRSGTQGNMDKVPTALSYDMDGELEGWGPAVSSTDDIKIQYFKLGLQENVDRRYLSGSVIGGFLSNSDWRHPSLPDKTPLDYSADYLSAIHDYFQNDYLPSAYGPAFLARQRVAYVITVPAIWTDKAKNLTRQAAVRAEIPDSQLLLITEPEAAALYCSTMCKEVDLTIGDRFLVCDAGGGTVVRCRILLSLMVGSHIIQGRLTRPLVHCRVYSWIRRDLWRYFFG